MKIIFVMGRTIKTSSYYHGGLENQDNVKRMFAEKNYEVVQYTEGLDISKDDFIIITDRQNLYENWKLLKQKGFLAQSACVLIESEVVDRQCGKKILNILKDAFPVVFTYQDDLIDNIKFFRYNPTINSRMEIKEKAFPFRDLGMATMICKNKIYKGKGELYTERKRIIEYFEDRPELSFGLYGPKYGNEYKNWKGVCKTKGEAYSRYRFAFCLENSRVNGYVTEKIFDCFQEGIVPIYGGAYNIEKYVPKDCFIDYYDYRNLDEIVDYIKKIDEKRYGEYLKAIDSFLKSDRFKSYMNVNLESIIQAIKIMPHTFEVRWMSNVKMYIYIWLYKWRKEKEAKIRMFLKTTIVKIKKCIKGILK